MRPFTMIAAAIFLLMALVHLYRIAVGFPIAIGGMDIGQGVSWVAFVVTLGLAAGLFREAGSRNVHDVTLTARLNPTNPKEITIRSTHLPYGSGGHHFKFTLDDKTGQNVQFAKLTSADDCSTCPPDTTKPNTQIWDDKTHNDKSPRWAEFKNKNDNRKPHQPVPMDVSYQWTFTCDDKTITVLPFDPIISNGGKT